MKPIGAPASVWCPDGLSEPGSSGKQNDLRYAFFPKQRRLAIERNGKVTQFNTGDHIITGVVQQQGGGAGDGSPRFTSQHGEVALASLRRVG